MRTTCPTSAAPAFASAALRCQWNRTGGSLLLDPGLSGIEIQAAILDVLIDFLGSGQKGIFNIFSRFRTRFKKNQSVLVSKLSGFFCCDVTLCFQITFVPDEKDDSVGIG
eukprot:m.149281 g.149281  ORF g.149281 m.149281 type:complete len:110 (+) comp17811_c0_seq1:367-696(+)